MNILRELYYGNIAEANEKMNIDEKKLNQETKCYDRLKAELNEELNEILEEFIDLYGERLNNFAEDKYINGFKTGLLIAIECFRKDIID